MRLTLRTLLAYLDDTLEPAEAKLIGEKVTESEAAQELMARIKLVTRRRRLTSPPLTGPGSELDPNTIAEYLDNALPPDQLAEVEETCLKSDVHLAEVAASHQILTLVLGEPMLVPPTARTRMYGLIHGRESIPNRKVPASAIGQGGMGDSDLQSDEAEDALLLGLPLYRQGGWMRWLAPLVTLCLLVAAGAALWMALMANTPRVTLASALKTHDQLAERPINPPEPPSPAEAEKRAAAEEKKAEIDVIPPAPPVEKAEPPRKRDTLPPPKPEPKVVATQEPGSERVALARANWTPPCVLLQRSGEKSPWQQVPQQKRVYATDYLMCLPGYHCDVRLDSGVQLMLWGALPQLTRSPTVLECAVILYAGPNVDLDFRLDHGRVILANQKEVGPATIRLRFRNEVWDLTLMDQKSVAAVELFGKCRPYSREAGESEPDIYADVIALEGELQVKARREEHTLTAPSILEWDTTFGLDSKPQTLPRRPDWWTNRQAPKTPDAQGMQAALGGLSSRLSAKSSIDVVLAETLRDPDIYSRVLALRCLGAINELSALLDALADDKFLELRMRAIEELRHLLGLSTKYDESLRKVLKQKNYSEVQCQTILQLLHGLADEQWDDPATRATLVDFLSSDKIAIRQLSHDLLCRFLPEGVRIGYDAGGDTEQRERGHEEWRKLISRVKPAGKPKS